jgi:hypothetical protein
MARIHLKSPALGDRKMTRSSANKEARFLILDEGRGDNTP